jgi:hypothetical protein
MRFESGLDDCRGLRGLGGGAEWIRTLGSASLARKRSIFWSYQ